jgi:nitrogen fixation protein FixH
MNWGHKITIVYLTFMAFTIGLVVICMKQKDLFLVSNNYYEEEIAYQDKIDKMHNFEKLQAKPEWQYDQGQQVLEFRFPEGFSWASGEIYFFRPSDANQDMKISIRPDGNGRQTVNTQNLSKGLWKVKLQWDEQGKAYYHEKVLVL